MADAALPVGFAVFAWWFSTGLILWLDRLPAQGVRWGLWTSSALALSALVGLAQTAEQLTPANAYCAFSCTLVVWGWHELTFLSGWLTGPRRHALAPGTVGWPRFVQSVRVILWHEIGLLLMGVLILTLTWGGPNQVGSLAFGVLWVMRLSAKLNLYFGVRNFSEAFLPPHLQYLPSFFRRRPMNAFFPFAVSAATVAAGGFVHLAFAAGATAGEQAGWWLLSTLMALAVLEHWLLVLPLEATALWRWALRRRHGGETAPVAETWLHAR
jgi:putative photosynthetic complex assembly protein 2